MFDSGWDDDNDHQSSINPRDHDDWTHQSRGISQLDDDLKAGSLMDAYDDDMAYDSSMNSQLDDSNRPYHHSRSTYSSSSPDPRHLGLSDEDWNEARQELADLGLEADPMDPSYHHHQPHLTDSSSFSDSLNDPSYHQFPTRSGPGPDYDDNQFTKQDYYDDILGGGGGGGHHPRFSSSSSTDTNITNHRTEDLAHAHHELDSNHLFNDHSPEPADFSPGRWSSDHDSQPLNSLLSPGRSEYEDKLGDDEFSSNHERIPFPEYDQIHFAHDEPSYHLSDRDPYPLGLGNDLDPVFDRKGGAPNLQNPGLHSVQSNGLYPTSPREDDLYAEAHQYPWNRRSGGDRDVRFEDGHPPTSIDSDSLDPSLSTTFDQSGADLLHHHHPSDQAGRSAFSNELPSDSDWSYHHHPSRDDYGDNPRSQKSPFDIRSSREIDTQSANDFRSPIFDATSTEPLHGFTTHSSRHPRASYSPYQPVFDQDHLRARVPNYQDDLLASTSPARSWAHEPRLGETGRFYDQPLNDIHNHSRSFGPLDTRQSSHTSQRRDIERMRAQLDASLDRDILSLDPHLAPGRRLSRSWEPPPSALSGRQLPHPNSTRNSWASPAVSLMTPKGEPLVGLHARSRTPSVIGHSGYRPSQSLASHRNSLGNQLHQLENIDNKIRLSEQAHQRDLALVNQLTNQIAQQSLSDELHRNEATHQLASQEAAALAQQSLAQDLRRNEIARQQDLVLAGQRASQIGQHSMIQTAREKELYRELDQQRRDLSLQRAEIERQRDRVDSQIQLNSIDRELQAIDRQREIDRNRQLANLSRLGNLPSVLRGNYGGRPLASPYLQQSRFLSAARRWSDRDKSRYRTPIVYDHIDAYYRLMTDHLPRHLPMFKDPYYSYGSSFLTSSKTPLGSLSSTRLLNNASRMNNPFVDGIDYDYGYGRVGSLGLKLERFAREQAHILDDLYLFEMLLRLDQTIDELERERRWRARLRWEEWADNRARVEQWRRMSAEERRRLGLSEGSFWASSLFGIPLDSRFGYTRALNFRGYKPTGLGPHYSLSSSLASRYPMWKRGGLGLGRRISNWYDYARRPIKQKHLDRQEQIRREYAMRRGELPPGSLYRSPSLSLSGASRRPGLYGGLGSTSSMNPNLLSPLPPLQIPGFTSSLSKLPSFASRNLTGSREASKPTTLSGLGSTSLKNSYGTSSKPHPTSTSASAFLTSKSGLKMPETKVPPATSQKTLPRTSASTTLMKPVPRNLGPTSAPSGSHSSRPSPNVHQESSSTSRSQAAKETTTSRPEGGTIKRSTTPTVVFNPRVKAVQPESESDPPLEPRPPSRTSTRPIRSALKTPPPTLTQDLEHPRQSTLKPLSVSLLDEQRLASITKTNTERNRSTPAPPDDPEARRKPN